jgi:hypothetical protein
MKLNCFRNVPSHDYHPLFQGISRKVSRNNSKPVSSVLSPVHDHDKTFMFSQHSRSPKHNESVLVKTQAKRNSQLVTKNKHSSNITMKDYKNYPPEEVTRNQKEIYESAKRNKDMREKSLVPMTATCHAGFDKNYPRSIAQNSKQ